MAKKSHLTKTQLEQLKKHLLIDRDKLLKTIDNLKAQDPFNDPDYINDNAAIDTDVREQIGHDTVEAETKTLKRKIRLIEKALKKIDLDTYGFDEKTGKPIPFDRLSIVPEAKYTIETERKLVK
ncbi:hypothetical protein A3I56_03535 [Candidatus Roizmanbacteria bacterium RIFCSPLOWO2_02_FULL_43_10]|uniref:Uncharacterized protein n=3 Tax=Candidatus Roizmaniibacteriota TaxID=1752723 RepID=A0A1F7JT76_9BACT|nr:MAG: hypothetical protein A3D08_03565 [Candidatus Roizmanbacteria bacterium RIFCSPHIGHO2_02_FULL_43_11]OGK38270.1 MAG: hypothetical protein A3F32_02620 [Candidatus Roizmanbacteria bacterium RIFCSPHIGHO2_12_FULL_42_10]OGK58807.1 MAG: hypothetical protein A3I56_03535 [Candidatus Roizmanbacteria bacterium RIFCSPLOWO2_02_FULL_43_10]